MSENSWGHSTGRYCVYTSYCVYTADSRTTVLVGFGYAERIKVVRGNLSTQVFFPYFRPKEAYFVTGTAVVNTNTILRPRPTLGDPGLATRLPLSPSTGGRAIALVLGPARPLLVLS
jgi:hypothetical protein